MGRFARQMAAFAFPGGVLLLAAVGFLRPRGLPPLLQQPVAAIPYIVLTFGLIFGWFLSNHRLILSLLALASADHAIAHGSLNAQGHGSTEQSVFALTAFLMPLNLLTFSLLKPDAVTMVRTVCCLILVCAQPVLLWWLSPPDQQELAASVQRVYVGVLGAGWTPVPQAALMAFLLAGATHLTQFILRRDPLEAGSFWAIGAVFLAFHGTQSGWHPTNFFSAGGLILFLAVVQSAHQQAYRDELTGTAGLQAYEEAIGGLGSRYAFAVLEVDQLKSYSNAHGKAVGEQIFKLLAPLVQTSCREAKVYRISGEELIVLFPGCSAMASLAALDRVRKTVASTSLMLRGRDRVRECGKEPPAEGDRELPVTLSVGVAEQAGAAKSLDAVRKAAYRALYEAKSAGGNLIRRSSAVPEEPRRASRSRGRIVASGEY